MVQSQVVKVGDQLVGSSRVDIFFGLCQYIFPILFFYTLFRHYHNAFGHII